jgi:hypothetical protein
LVILTACLQQPSELVRWEQNLSPLIVRFRNFVW